MKHNYFTKIVFVFISFLVPARGFSQLVVNAGGTTQQILNSMIGAGLTVSNVQLNCGTDTVNPAYGTFNGSASNLGVQNGVILTTGWASNAVGPNNSNSSTGSTTNTFSDSDLTSISPLAINDPCILEFDVIPHCSSMQLRFVFGSEEYPEFVNLGFNDAFGFFVTGPDANCNNPLGFNHTNVAILPSGTPVSIDSVNNGNASGCPTTLTGPCTNCAYYVNNCGGTTVQYDGFTTVITVSLTVCPCATYHWKFAIADAGDHSYDSGVLIDLLSCVSPFNYTVNSADALCSCNGTASVNVTAGTPPFSYQWSTGDTTQSVSGLCPGTYTVNVIDASSCSIPTTQTFVIGGSASTPPAFISPTGTTTVCNSSGVDLLANTGDYFYQWYNNGQPISGATGDSYLAITPGVYYVQVSDASGCSTSSVTDTIIVGGGPIPTIAAATGCGNVLYNGGSTTLTASAQGAVSYQWSQNGSLIPGATSATLQVTQPGTYCVTAVDANGCQSTAPSCTSVSSADVTCGNHNQKVVLCHLPPGNPSNHQTLCIAPSAVPAHLANHPGDCVGSCDLYYRIAGSAPIEILDFLAEVYPNPFNHNFTVHVISSEETPVTVMIHDITGRIIETNKDVTEQTQLGANLSVGIYFAEVLQGDNSQMLRIVKEK
jgi:hypothetical protein